MSESHTSAPSADIPNEAMNQRRKLGRLGPILLSAHFLWMLPVAASGTLIQSLMEQIDADTKVALYATLAASGALAAALANIVFGSLSDRTRTRWGARNPWILGGGLVASGAMLAMSFVTDFVVLVGLWMLFQLALNAFLSPLIAILPDRVAPSSLGTASSYIGVGQLAAQSLGAVMAGSFVAVPAEGLRILPAALVLASLLIFILAPDRDNRQDLRPSFSLRGLLASFKVPRDADFLWALVGRFLLLLAFMLVVTYQLFLLTDFIGLELTAAGGVIAVGGLVMAAASAVSTLISGPLSDRIRRRKPLVMGAAVLVALAVLPMTFSPSVATFYIFLAVGGFGYGIYVAVDQALMAEVLPDQEHRAKDLGILNVANTLPQILAPVVAGVLVGITGYQGVLLIATVVGVVSAVCIAPIRRVR